MGHLSLGDPQSTLVPSLTKFLLIRQARGAHSTQSLGHPHAEHLSVPHPNSQPPCGLSRIASQ